MEESFNDIRGGGRVSVGVDAVQDKRKQSFGVERFKFVVSVRSAIAEFITEANQRRECFDFFLRAVAEQMVEKDFSGSILTDSKCPRETRRAQNKRVESFIRVNMCRIRKGSKMIGRRIMERVIVINHVAKTPDVLEEVESCGGDDR